MLPAVVRPAMPRAALRPALPANLPPLRAVKLLDQLRERVRMLHYSRRTEQAYLYWSRAFIRFHGLRHPAEMGGPEVEAFLTYLASDRGLSPSSHRQALSALLFLYGKVLGLQLPWMQEIGRPVPMCSGWAAVPCVAPWTRFLALRSRKTVVGERQHPASSCRRAAAGHFAASGAGHCRLTCSR